MVLEPGCGSCKFALAYALRGCIVTALDIDPDAGRYATRIMNTLDCLIGGFRYRPVIREGDIHNLPYRDASWDLVFNEGVPQHYPDEERRQGSINEMARVARNAVVIIGNNGLNPSEQETDRTFSFGYMGMPPMRKCFTPGELKGRMEAAGLVDVRVESLTYPMEAATLIAGWGRKP